MICKRCGREYTGPSEIEGYCPECSEDYESDRLLIDELIDEEEE